MRASVRMNRRHFLGGATAAAVMPALSPSPVGLLHGLFRGCCPVRLADPVISQTARLSDVIDGNRRAIEVASQSSLISGAWEGLRHTARGIDDRGIRTETLRLLESPAPTYQLRSPTRSDR